jgi:hypothetical protein
MRRCGSEAVALFQKFGFVGSRLRLSADTAAIKNAFSKRAGRFRGLRRSHLCPKRPALPCRIERLFRKAESTRPLGWPEPRRPWKALARTDFLHRARPGQAAAGCRCRNGRYTSGRRASPDFQFGKMRVGRQARRATDGERDRQSQGELVVKFQNNWTSVRAMPSSNTV